jgi:ubiquinone/menaquinone biosynthesis C-methylase UbiE
MPDDPLQNPEQKIAELLRGYFVSQALYVAAKLQLADRVAQAPNREVSIEDLARETATDPDSLYRLLRALAAEGIFEERPERRFALNAMAAAIRSDGPGSTHAAALLAGETQYKVWTQLKDTLRPGAPTGFERIFRQPLFDFLADHPEAYAVFNAAMDQRVRSSQKDVIESCQVRPGDHIIDIGGGLGRVVTALLEKYPESRGTLLETAPVIAEAQTLLAHNPVRERLAFFTGNCLQALPPGDVMILITVLHMFQDRDALRILQNCRASLAPNGRLYIAEALLRPANESDPAKWQDLNMLLMTGGRERTFEEFAALLRTAGFTHITRKADILEAHSVS